MYIFTQIACPSLPPPFSTNHNSHLKATIKSATYQSISLSGVFADPKITLSKMLLGMT